MGSRTIYFCDRCGKEFLTKGFTSTIILQEVTPTVSKNIIHEFSGNSSKELCDSCMKYFFEWYSGKYLGKGEKYDTGREDS